MYSELTGHVLPSITRITDVNSSLCTALYDITEYFGTLHNFTIHHLNLVIVLKLYAQCIKQGSVFFMQFLLEENSKKLSV